MGSRLRDREETRDGHAEKKEKKAPRPARKRPAPRPQRQQPESLRLRSMAASFTVNDLDKSVAWYRDVLGFVVGEHWEEGGSVRGIQMKAGACDICWPGRLREGARSQEGRRLPPVGWRRSRHHGGGGPDQGERLGNRPREPSETPWVIGCSP